MSVMELLARDGYVRISLPAGGEQLLSAFKAVSLEAFSYADDLKQSQHFNGKRIGYRPIGGEYTGDPTQWDINESMSFSEMDENLIGSPGPFAEFYALAREMAQLFDRLAQVVLTEIAAVYDPNMAPPATLAASWFQTNFYRAAIADTANRDLMQGRHEDGHLLTVWHSTEPGMEIFPRSGGEAVPVCACSAEILIFPGDLLKLATAGDVAPLYHQVRRSPSVEQRLAVMYFVNPDIDKEFLPFSQNAPRYDLADLARREKIVIRPSVMMDI